jgi:hypothetical protein
MIADTYIKAWKADQLYFFDNAENASPVYRQTLKFVKNRHRISLILLAKCRRSFNTIPFRTKKTICRLPSEDIYKELVEEGTVKRKRRRLRLFRAEDLTWPILCEG